MQPRLRHVLVALALLAAVSGQAGAQPKKPKTGLNEEDWKYTLANGVTTREVNYYSDDTACYAKMFFPKGFSPKAKVPGVVLGQGWAGTHYSIEKYGARFAERGLVAMVIDYRGWGMSSGFLSLAEKLKVPDDVKYPDDVRFTRTFRRKIDVETQQMVAEYRPFHYLNRVGKRPVLFIVAEKEELMNNRDHAYAAAETLQGPKKVLEIPAVTHFEMYIDEAFEKSSNAAADWFLEHLEVGKP